MALMSLRPSLLHAIFIVLVATLLSGCDGPLRQLELQVQQAETVEVAMGLRCRGAALFGDPNAPQIDTLACHCLEIDGNDPECWGFLEYGNKRVPRAPSAKAPVAVPQSGTPEIPLDGIVSAASFVNRTMPAGGIAQGAIFTIFGSDIGPDPAVAVSSFPLGTELGGVEIRVFTATAEYFAIPLFVGRGQINAIMPSDVPVGFVAVEVVFNGQLSNVAPVHVVAAGVGIFTATGAGVGQGSITNFITQIDQPLNNVTRPGAPGQVVIAWVTGLGGIAGSDTQRPIDVGVVVDVRDRVDLEVYVGGKLVTNIIYAGRSAEFSGLDQLVFVIPADVELGCSTSLIVLANGIPSNTVTIATAQQGSACPQITTPFIGPTGEGVVGAVTLLRLSGDSRADLDAPVADFAFDLGSATFVNGAPAGAGFSSLFNLPPLGTCLAAGQLTLEDSMMQDPTTVDAGTTVTVVRSADMEQRIIRFDGEGGLLGGGLPDDDEITPLFFEPGAYRLESDGGSQVGAFGIDFDLPAPVQWTNRDDLAEVNRDEGFEVTWQGGVPGQAVVLMGTASNGVEFANASFVCTADALRGSITVSPRVLANFPNGRIPEDGSIMLVSTNHLAAIEADGLSSGELSSILIDLRTTLFSGATASAPLSTGP